MTGRHRLYVIGDWLDKAQSEGEEYLRGATGVLTAMGFVVKRIPCGGGVLFVVMNGEQNASRKKTTSQNEMELFV